MDAGASASARPAGLPVHDARPVGYAHPASRARPAGAASHSRKGAGRGLDRPLAASATVIMRARSFNRPLSDGEGHPLGLRDYMERPAGVGHDTVDGETAGDGIVVVRDLDAQGDLRWKDVVADFLVHVSGGIVRWDAQDQASVVLCGPQVAVLFDFQSEAVTPVLGDDGDPLDYAAASFEGLRCHVRSVRRAGSRPCLSASGPPLGQSPAGIGVRSSWPEQ